MVQKTELGSHTSSVKGDVVRGPFSSLLAQKMPQCGPRSIHLTDISQWHIILKSRYIREVDDIVDFGDRHAQAVS